MFTSEGSLAASGQGSRASAPSSVSLEDAACFGSLQQGSAIIAAESNEVGTPRLLIPL